MRLLTLGLALTAYAGAFASLASAQSQARLTQAMFIERVSNNGATREVTQADELRKGDRIILLVKWKAAAAGSAFTVSSAVPKALAFERSSIRSQTVSINGGRTWGIIGDLTVRSTNGSRLATVEDVTHLRWKISAARAARGNGTITYSAIVR